MNRSDDDSAELANLVQRLERQRRARTATEAVSDQATRDLYRLQKDLLLLQGVGVATNEAASFEEAVQASLDQVCGHTGWPLGHALLPLPDGTLTSSGLWFVADRELCEPVLSAAGQAGPRPVPDYLRAVMDEAAPSFLFDLSTQDDPILAAAFRCGLSAAFSFPVPSTSGVAAILQFFSPSDTEIDPPLLEAMTQIGRLLGRVLERDGTTGQLVAEEYRDLFDHGVTPMWVYDVSSLAFLSANDAAVRHYGYSREEFTGRTLRDVYLLEDGRVDFNDQGLWKHRLKDGTIIDVQISSHELALPQRRARLVQAVDVSDRTRNEEALRISERRFRDLLQNVQLISVLFDVVGTIIFCNGYFLDRSGYSKTEVIGQNWFDLMIPIEAREAAREKFLDGLRSGNVAAHEENEIVTKDGDRLLISWDSTLLRDSNGSIMASAGIGSDITARRRTEEALIESEERYALAVRGANDGLWDWDLRACRVFFSPRWKSMLGLHEDEEISSPEQWFTRVHPSEVSQFMERIDAHLNGHTPHFEHEHRVRHADGGLRWMLARGLAVRGEDGVPYRMAGSQTDITERKRVEEQLQHDAFHDSLTGLPNRALFIDRLTQALRRRRKDSLCAVLFLDLDRFKVVNDSLGHSSGDALLVDFASRLQRGLRAGDTVARFGGDEFVILIEGIADVSDATRAADRIREELANPFVIAGSEIYATVSIGLALNGSDPVDPDDLLRDADTAMYRAKALGPGRYEVFDAGMRTRAISLLQIETDLRRAIERSEFVLHYQAIVEMETGVVEGFEALVRWNHPQKGLLPPAEFISVAEETGLIVPMGEWILEEACRQAAQWSKARPVPLSMHVNLSSRQFSEPDLDQKIVKILQSSGMTPAELHLEITESVLMANAQAAAEMMARLRVIGVKVAVDDFGTGYSSLSYVHSFPIDTLKIDTSFVKGLTTSRKNLAIVRTIIELARNLEMKIVAEGVETQEQQRLLAALRCDRGQGYLFSRPVPALEAAALISTRLGEA